MPYPYDDDDDTGYEYGLSEREVRDRMRYAIEGDERDERDFEDPDFYAMSEDEEDFDEDLD